MKKMRIAVVLLAALAACTEPEEILEGDRFELDGTPVAPEAQPAAEAPRAFAAPAVVRNADWTHRAGTPGSRPAHVALDYPLTPLWTASIGEGNGKRHRISSGPIVGGGRIFTHDSRATVTAFGPNGAELWRRDLTPAGESDDASGGGIAYDAGRIYVGSGFGFVAALDAATGAVLWQQKIGAPASGAPTVAGARVYAVGADSTGWALDARTGRIDWTVSGAPARASFVGGASPLVTPRLVVFPYPSGALSGNFPKGGFEVWTSAAAGTRLGRAISRITDIAGDPVLAGGRIVTGSPSGRTVAIDPATGEILWSTREGAVGPLWVAGDSVFLISDRNALVRLDLATGATIWQTELPFFTETREKNQAAIYAHYGPLLASGRLLVASNDGLLRVFDPATGTETGSIEIGGEAAAQPVVAGGVLYILTADGMLRAFR